MRDPEFLSMDCNSIQTPFYSNSLTEKITDYNIMKPLKNDLEMSRSQWILQRVDLPSAAGEASPPSGSVLMEGSRT